MPVRHVTTRGLPGYRWGRRGTVYTYGPGTGRTKQESALLAARQGRAIAARRLERDRALHARGDARRIRVPYGGRAPLFSDRITSDHQAMLHARIAAVQSVVMEALAPELEGLTLAADARADGYLEALQVIRVAADFMRRWADGDAPGLEYLGDEVEDDALGASDRLVSRLLNIPVAAALPEPERLGMWVSDNVALIRSIDARHLSEIERLVSTAVGQGVVTGTGAKGGGLIAQIEERFSVSRSRASLIARDQTARLASQVARERQANLGVTRAQWSTSGDEQVRQSHADLDGVIYLLAEGAPSENGYIQAGEEFQCRCLGVPVLDPDDEARLVAEATARQEEELRILQGSPVTEGRIQNRSGFQDWNRGRLRDLRSGLRSAVGLDD